MSKKPLGPVLAAVVWSDAHSDLEQTWIQADGFTHSVLRVTTVGWVIKHDNTGLSLYAEQIDDTDAPSFRGRTTIPAGMILSVTPLVFRSTRKSRHVPPAAPLTAVAVVTAAGDDA